MINTPRNGPRKAPFSISSPQSGCQSLDISLGLEKVSNERQHGSLAAERKPLTTNSSGLALSRPRLAALNLGRGHFERVLYKILKTF